MSIKKDQDCYFRLDSLVDGDLAANDVQTFDSFANKLSASESTIIGRDVNLDENLNITGFTEANSLQITSSAPQSSLLTIDCQNNRISNVARPYNACSPIPANYIPYIQYMSVTTLKYFSLRVEAGEKMPFSMDGWDSRSSDLAESCFQLYDIGSNDKYILQLIKKGTYVIQFSATKKWDWNNGYGGHLVLRDLEGDSYCRSPIHSGGGYSAQAFLSTIIKVDRDLAPGARDTRTSLWVQSDRSWAVFKSIFWNLIYYPDVEQEYYG